MTTKNCPPRFEPTNNMVFNIMNVLKKMDVLHESMKKPYRLPKTNLV